MSTHRSMDEVLAAEQAFFDEDAARLQDKDLVIPPDQMARYRNARPHPGNSPKDTMYSLLLPLAGKRVVEYGCGFGEDSCHLADCGATVNAFDLSPVSVQKARRRAELLGVADRITFDVKQAGRTGYETGAFDVAVGIAILHHLHTELDLIYGEAARLLKPGGVACFAEPVANSAVLRGIRPLVPVPRNATPDERQLTYADFELMKKHGFARVEYHHFHGVGRLRRVLGGRSSGALRRIDHHLQRVAPFLKPFYGIVLVRATRA
jgi:2-polyprenyl-3-methyl-5-hydroxy-6-metoxy-1,4-benzoquinol methylase